MSAKVAQMLQTRTRLALERFSERVHQAYERQGLPPVLHFDYEMVMDGRSLERRVNYALLRIVQPKGVTADAKRRPYVTIDPRGGHGLVTDREEGATVGRMTRCES